MGGKRILIEFVDDGNVQGTKHGSRKRSRKMIVDYEKTFPDDESISKGIFSRKNIMCTGKLNRLRERARRSLYQSLGFVLWEPRHLLDWFIKVLQTASSLKLRRVPLAGVYGRGQKDRSHLDYITHQNGLKRKQLVVKHWSKFSLVMQYKETVTEWTISEKELRSRRVLKLRD